MTKIRAYLFSCIFIIWSITICVIASPLLLLPFKNIILKVPQFWAKSSMFMLRTIVGLKYELRGVENIPNQPCIIACKHQSAFETCVFHEVFPKTAYIFKKSLGLIPFVGWFMFRSGSISVDRGSGSIAMRSILNGTQKRINEGFNVVIFPEGTRTTVGQKTTYNPGVSFLYDKLPDVPVVPVAINSGLFWPRYSFLKLSGNIIIEFLPPIEKGLNKREFITKLADTIEAKTAEIVKEGKNSLASNIK